MDRVKNNCLKCFVPEENLCYNDCMVKYFERHRCKQYIRGKPIRFGYKIWSLNAPSAYLVNFEKYQGNNPRRSLEYEKNFGKSAAPLVAMLEELKEAKGYTLFRQSFHGIVVDKIPSGQRRSRNRHSTRKSHSILPYCNQKSMDKKPRGSYESVIDRTDGISIVRWVDNSTVTAASSCFGVEPITNVRRYSQAEKQHIQVPRPNIIGKYSQSMGGNDQMDENTSQYRIAVKGKKWWWCLFTWIIDVCAHNAWQCHRKSGGTFSQLEFRHCIAQAYLKTYGTPPKGAGRPSTSSSSVSLNRVSDELRYDSVDHLVVSIPHNKRRCCAGEGCSSHLIKMIA
ncbi:hypothetical protein GEV33_007531 [Tenebrio molitor]|uniref:PiggyBac transposable element-derived protein domain-containing protein n=1 Tax=Tenebrio molitor TaxID=7067 RepID=A0A8J6HAN0_TENMO|nr:hypothetical protein GEV33_007531 [Tenebrio molitor]